MALVLIDDETNFELQTEHLSDLLSAFVWEIIAVRTTMDPEQFSTAIPTFHSSVGTPLSSVGDLEIDRTHFRAKPLGA